MLKIRIRCKIAQISYFSHFFHGNITYSRSRLSIPDEYDHSPKPAVTEEPCKHVKSGNYRPASETPYGWRFASGPIVARDGMQAGIC